MKPYIVRFISSKSGAGKTLVASEVVLNLVKRGFPVTVIKHAISSISLEEKDSKKYLQSGASEVVVSSRELTLIYSKELVDDLSELVSYLSRPLIIVEGFKEGRIGDVVVVAKEAGDAIGLISSNTIAVVITGSYVASEDHRVSTIPILRVDQTDALADLIIEKATKYIASQLPGLNCGQCGLSTCEALALKILRREKVVCPLLAEVKLVVNDIEVYLNPFVRNVMISVMDGLLAALKGVPKDIKRIELRIAKN